MVDQVATVRNSATVATKCEKSRKKIKAAIVEQKRTTEADK